MAIPPPPHKKKRKKEKIIDRIDEIIRIAHYGLAERLATTLKIDRYINRQIITADNSTTTLVHSFCTKCGANTLWTGQKNLVGFSGTSPLFVVGLA